MAETKPSLWRRILKLDSPITVGQWVADRITNNWHWIVGFFAGGGMSYLASVTAWLRPWGPIGYGAIGYLTFVMTALGSAYIYYLISLAREKSTVAAYVARSMQTIATNVLAPTHNHERIRLADFFHPFYKPTKNVRFEDCELHGPANIFLAGGTMVDSTFADCEIIITRSDRPMRGILVFENCMILRCEVYRATLLMDITHYNGIPAPMRAALPVVSDGRIGDI